MPNNNSGGLYHKVTTINVYAFKGDPYSLARLRSPTLKIPLWIRREKDQLISNPHLESNYHASDEML